MVGGDAGSHGGTLAHAVGYSVTLSYCYLMHWLCSAQVVLSDKLNTSAAVTFPEERIRPSSSSAPQPRPDMAPPFLVAYDVPRGIMRLVLASINFLLMLTVM